MKLSYPSPVFWQNKVLAIVSLAVCCVVGLFIHTSGSPPGGNIPLSPLPLQFTAPECRADSRFQQAEPDAEPWSMHPTDRGQVGTCVSEPFVAQQPYVLVRYAGNPTDAGLQVALGRGLGSASETLPILLPRPALHGWLTAAVQLPPAWRETPVRLIIQDTSTHPNGWVRVRALVQTDAMPLSLLPYWNGWAAAAVTAMATVALLTLWFLPGMQALPVWALFCLATGALYLRYPSFYHWDEYALLKRYAAGAPWQSLLHYNGHWEPLFLATFAGAVNLVGSWYAPLQLLMVLGHAGVSCALLTLLRGHGVQPRACVVAAALYGSSWLHVDVAPWFMEVSFLLTAALALGALHALLRRGASRWAMPQAMACALLACLWFTGGLVVPWLCTAYLVLFDGAATRRWQCAFAALGAFMLGMAVVLLRVLGDAASANAPHMRAILAYWGTGILHSAWPSYLGLRGRSGTGLLVLIALLSIACKAGQGPPRRWALLGVVWLTAAYALQALARANMGAAQAMSFRYTYFAMLGAAMVLASGVDALLNLRPWLHVVVFVSMAVLVQTNHRKTLKRLSSTESEYFAINRQYFELARLWDDRACGHGNADMPKTVLLGGSRRDYMAVLPPLDSAWPRHPTDSTCAVLDGLLAP